LGTDEKTGKQGLLRREKVNPGKDVGTEGRVQLVCPDVEELKFAYWNEKEGVWNDQWNTEGALPKQGLPPRVKIQVKAKMQNDQTETFLTQAEIWLLTPILIK